MRYAQKLKSSKKIIFFILTFVACLALFYFVKKTFSISTITVLGGDIEGTREMAGELIFLVNEKKVEEKLFNKNADLKNVSVTKKFPSSIIITITKEEPIAVLRLTDGYYYLSSFGRILYKRRLLEIPLPIITSFEKVYYSNYETGEQIRSKDIQYSLFFIDKMKDLGIYIKTVAILGFDVLVLNADNTSYMITTAKDQKSQYSELSQVITHLSIEGKGYKTLDLRFEKPIIKLN